MSLSGVLVPACKTISDPESYLGHKYNELSGLDTLDAGFGEAAS